MNRLRARLRAWYANSGQCSVCGLWFDDWDGGVCGPCQR